MTKKFFFLASLGLLVLGAAMWRLGENAHAELLQVATAQFNRQQLILAEKIAQDIRLHFRFLRAGLLQTADVWRRQPARIGREGQPIPLRDFMLPSHILALGLVQPGENVPVLSGQDGPIPARDADIGLADLLDWAGRDQTGETCIAPCRVPTSGPFAGRLVTVMAARLWQGTPGAGRPGLVFFVVDAKAVADRYASDVRSGQTGYAWIVDQNGLILDHPEDELVGQRIGNVLERRSLAGDARRLDGIVRDRMLVGGQGEDWYTFSGHGTRTGPTRKLMAYTPVDFSSLGDGGALWSVAVSAPASEVEDIFGSVLTRQVVMVAIFQVVVFLGLAITVYFAVRWSATLQSEVMARTRELSEAQDKLRANLQTLVETQERLIRSERFAAVGEAAARMAHEIKNPLMLIAGFARQVRRAVAGQSREEEKLKLVEEEAARLEAMLDEVRDFTRPTPPRLVLGDVNATIRETAALMETHLTGKGVVLRMNLDQTLPPAPHDPSRIHQVVLNLIKNAAEAMPDGGTVSVSSRCASGVIVVEVADTGSGLTPEETKRIFNPFYTTKDHGTGLGLAVCYRIMADHGGDIRVSSQPGKGSVFTLSLPVAGPPPSQED